jgi:glyoxylate reductase
MTRKEDSYRQKRVFATCNIGDSALEKLRAKGYELEVCDQDGAPPYEVLLNRVRSGVDGLVTTVRDQIDDELFRLGARTLRVVSQYAVGYDNIDREAANRHKIPFTNTSDVLTDATAEFAFFIMGAAARRLYPSEELVRTMQWRTWHPWKPFLGDEVTGKCVAVVGTGRIGKAFALKCVGFDMDLLCFDPQRDDQFVASVQEVFDLKLGKGLTKRKSTIRYVDLDEALGTADFVSLHVPLNQETRHLIDRNALHKMRQSSYLINTSRGPVVDEKALYEALRKGWIAGAALDVYEEEPLPDDSPLRDPALTGRLRLLHHFGSGTKQTRLSPDPDQGMAGRCVQGVIDVLEGNYEGNPRKMPFVVNKEAF